MVINNSIYKESPLITFEDKDSQNQIEIFLFNEKDLSIWIDKEQASQIIDHLKEQFGL